MQNNIFETLGKNDIFVYFLKISSKLIIIAPLYPSFFKYFVFIPLIMGGETQLFAESKL